MNRLRTILPRSHRSLLDAKRVWVLVLLFSFMVVMTISRAPHVQATTISVNSTGDGDDATAGDGVCETVLSNGVCTLRAAISEANATPGSGALTIAFNLTGGGPYTITPGSVLPALTRTNVTIDGTTQSGSSCGDLWSGSAPTWEIVIQGSGSLDYGLDISGGNSTVKGLSINGFTHPALTSSSIVLDTTGNDIVQCNSTRSSSFGIRVVSAANNLIGGTSTGQGNLVGANSQAGIIITGSSAATNNTIVGNFIGTNAAGTAADGNVNGVVMDHNVASNIVGGITTGARNLISGNTSEGVAVVSNATSTVIEGNYIGTDRTGTTALGDGNNAGIGDQGIGTLIGGTTPGSGNLISGLAAAMQGAITLDDTSAVVQGNLIGTDVTGIVSLGNLEDIVFQIGGATIGGTTPSARNVIVGAALGIGLVDLGVGNSNSVIQGNYIGVGADGSTPLGNTYGVVLIGAGTVNNMVGGTMAGAGNIIANSTKAGITTYDLSGASFGPPGVGNAFLGNSIYNNGVLGIHLSTAVAPAADTTTPVANDPLDADTGPNNLQNYPVLTAASTDGTSLTVTGTLNSEASHTYRLEFFSNVTADSSNHGQGKTYLGSINVNTDSSGNATFTASNLSNAGAGRIISATASKDEGSGHFSTSEFSQDVTVTTASSSSSGGDTSYIVGLPFFTPPPTQLPSTPTNQNNNPTSNTSDQTNNPSPSEPSTPAPTSVNDALATITRDLDLERKGIAWFVQRFLRLPASSPDWRAVNAWGYGQTSP